MGRLVRNTSGVLLLLAALAVLVHAILELRGREYVGAIILVLTGLSVLQAGVDLLRPSIGE